MDKINPAEYITDTDPTVEKIINVSNWYEWQLLELTVNNSEQLPWLLAQGWIIYDDTVFGWKLKRRVLKPETALHSLIRSFTNAYNEGRQLNDSRYDEIVTLFTVMLDKTEDNLKSLVSKDASYDDLVETLLSGMSSDYNTYKNDVDGIFDNFGDSERQRIKTQFDNQLSKVLASLKATGRYNTTIWDADSACIERERAIANTDLEDKILERRVAVKDRVYVLKTDMRGKILAARDRLRGQLQSLDLERVGLRNQVLSALLSFMERREDGYPDMGNIGQLTSNLGASNPTYPAP